MQSLKGPSGIIPGSSAAVEGWGIAKCSGLMGYSRAAGGPVAVVAVAMVGVAAVA